MKDWEPPDPRSARRARIEVAILAALSIFIAGSYLLDWLR